MSKGPPDAQKKYQLGDFVNLKRGYDLPHRDRVAGKVPIISSSGNSGSHNIAKVQAPGVVTGRYGTLGEVFYVDQDYWPLNTSLYVQNFKGNDPRFIYYYLQTILSASFNTAGAVPGVNRNSLHKLHVPALPKEQKKIAAVLAAYDDLLELNKRRIQVLESLAEEIYKEWFVRLRFPGYEDVNVVKGVPEGWSLKPFSSLVTKNPREQLVKGEEKPYVGMGDLSTTSMYFNYHEFRLDNSGGKFRNRDVLFPRITPSLENGKRGYVMTLAEDQVGLGSTEFIVFREKVIPSEFIYFLTCTPGFRQNAENSMVGASGRQRVQESCFNSFILKTPPPELLDYFSKTVSPNFSEIKVLNTVNRNLSQTRDLLLSRLISGKLSVADLDIAFPPSMQDVKEHTESADL